MAAHLCSSAVSTNTARDLGSRFMVLTIWGRGASGGSYAAIAALANIPATFSAALFYEFILADSSRGSCGVFSKYGGIILIDVFGVVITPTHLDFLVGHLAHAEHKESVVAGRNRSSTHSSSYEGKGHIETIERADRA